MPEVRALPSPGVTRLQRYYGPVRLPPGPPPEAPLKLRPPTGRVSLVTRITFPTCRIPHPGRPDRSMCRLLPCLRGLPRAKDGSASASTLSRPTRTSLTLQPIGLLDRPRRPSSRGFGPASYPVEPLVSYQINRQLSGWILPPLVIRAIEAHFCRRRSPSFHLFRSS